TASLLTILGAIALAISLALQGTLANFASGLVMLAFRMVRVGDTIEVSGVSGQVVEMLPFHLVMVTPDNQRVTVPNTLLTTVVVRNLTAMKRRRVEWTLPVAKDLDLGAAKAALANCVKADRRVLADPPPEVFEKSWSDDKHVLTVTAWTTTADFG